MPPRDITPQDVYNNVVPLKEEVGYLLKDKRNIDLSQLVYVQYHNKIPSDVYRELWMISIGFDKLLGQGFTLTDVYAQTEQIVKTIKFLRQSQREHNEVKIPPLKPNQHPNHALYKSVELVKQIHHIEKKL